MEAQIRRMTEQLAAERQANAAEKLNSAAAIAAEKRKTAAATARAEVKEKNAVQQCAELAHVDFDCPLSQASLNVLEGGKVGTLQRYTAAELNALRSAESHPVDAVACKRGFADICAQASALETLAGKPVQDVVTAAAAAGALEIHVRGIGDVLVEAAVRVVFKIDEHCRHWSELTGFRVQPPVRIGRSGPSQVDAYIMVGTASTLGAGMTGYRPTQADVDCVLMPVEFKASLQDGQELNRYRAVAQSLGWMFKSKGTKDHLAGGGKAYALVSDGLRWQLVGLCLRTEPWDPATEPASTPRLLRAYKLRISEPIVFEEADFDPERAQEGPPAAFKTLCSWVALLRRIMLARAGPPELWPDRLRPNVTHVLASDGEELPLELFRCVGVSPRASFFAARFKGAPATAAIMFDREYATRELDILQHVHAHVPDARHVPRILAHGLEAPMYVNSKSYVVVSDAVGTSLHKWPRQLTGAELRALVHDIGEALLALERAGVVHRDVTSSNIVGRPDRQGPMALIDYNLSVRVADFVDQQPDLGHFAGTPIFASAAALCGQLPAHDDDWEGLLITALAHCDGTGCDALRAFSREAHGLNSAEADERGDALRTRMTLVRAAMEDEEAIEMLSEHRARFEVALARSQAALDRFDDDVAPQFEVLRQDKWTLDFIEHHALETLAEQEAKRRGSEGPDRRE